MCEYIGIPQAAEWAKANCLALADILGNLPRFPYKNIPDKKQMSLLLTDIRESRQGRAVISRINYIGSF